MKRIITVFDKECLSALIRRMTTNPRDRNPAAEKLQEILESAEILAEAPEDVITLDSVAVLQSALSGEQRVYSPVLPALADHLKHRISVLAPLGMSMLGRRVGDTFEVNAPRGTRKVTVEKIHRRYDETDRGTLKRSRQRSRNDRMSLPLEKNH